jgi:hypothetical protein
MLGSDAHADEPARDPLEHRESGKEACHEWRAKRPPPIEHSCDHAVLDEDLDALSDPGRELAAPLERAEVLDRDAASTERGNEEIGRRDGVLDR